MAAKAKSDSGSKTNHVRFVMLEADLSEGNFSELTQAITSALRPAATSVRRIAGGVAPALGNNGNGHVEEPTLVEVEPDAELTEDDAPATPTPPRAPRTFPIPKYLHELFSTEEGASFKDHAAQQKAKKHLRRYLIATMWLKEKGKGDTVNADKMYTAYKTAGWPTGINDWDSNFRSLVKVNRLRRTSPGEYMITPLGESALQDETE